MKTLSFFLAKVEHGDDVRMLERGYDARLPKKPLHGFDVGLGTDGMDLQGNFTLEDSIESAVNDPHPAFADLPKDLVLADSFHGLCHP